MRLCDCLMGKVRSMGKSKDGRLESAGAVARARLSEIFAARCVECTAPWAISS
jgi:hypothetical protein